MCFDRPEIFKKNRYAAMTLAATETTGDARFAAVTELEKLFRLR
jgi:hypothetical protein